MNSLPTTINSGHTAWMLVSSVLVLLMLLPGLALFYGGMVRRKNVLAVLMQSIAGASVVSICWWLMGYSLTFGEGNSIIGGIDRFFLSGLSPRSISTLAPDIPETVFVMFQCSFAMITPVILLGGLADRLKFSSAMVFVALWTILVYCPIAHIVWGPGGAMSDRNTLYFAGGTVVHINADIAGLLVAVWVGKTRDLVRESLAPHNLILSFIGASLLWVGWFGFNAGSVLAANGMAGHVILATHLAATAGVIGWALVEWWLRGTPRLSREV